MEKYKLGSQSFGVGSLAGACAGLYFAEFLRQFARIEPASLFRVATWLLLVSLATTVLWQRWLNKLIDQKA